MGIVKIVRYIGTEREILQMSYWADYSWDTFLKLSHYLVFSILPYI